MLFKNSPTQYGVVTKSFHWIMALLILCMLFVGFYMTNTFGFAVLVNHLFGQDAPPGMSQKLALFNLHKSTGVIVLTLVTLRALWHIYSKRPHFVPSLKWWEKMAATALHYFLYIAMIGMPLSGWLFSSAAGRSVSFFGLFELPDLVQKDDSLKHLLGDVHWYLAWALVIAICMHAGAALKHQFIDKDATLRRMLPFTTALLMLLVSSQAFAEPPKWDIVPEGSLITYTFKQMGKINSGTFSKFTADIAFDQAHPEKSHVIVIIDVKSGNSKDQDRDGTMQGKEWFDSAKFPTARFESALITKNPDGTYKAAGNLTIRDVTQPVELPFKLDISKDDSGKQKANMTGSLTLDRSKFQLGQGDWTDTSVIANDVTVNVSLTAFSATP